MTLKIVSLNIWHGAFVDRVVEFLKAEDADVVMLQEVYNSQAASLEDKYHSYDILKADLSYSYSHFSQAYLEEYEGRLIPHGNAVFSKLPIVASDTVFLSDPTLESYIDKPEHWRILPASLQHVELQSDASPINVLNMHGVWDLDGDSLSERRRTMFERAAAAVQDKPNVILAGDTNATQSNPGFKLFEPTLKPVFTERLTTTFNMRHKENPGYATAAVDLMFVSPSIEVRDKAVSPADVSDHLPIVVSLQIN